MKEILIPILIIGIALGFVFGVVYERITTKPEVTTVTVADTSQAEYWRGKYEAKEEQIWLLQRSNDSLLEAANKAQAGQEDCLISLSVARAKLQIIEQLYGITIDFGVEPSGEVIP